PPARSGATGRPRTGTTPAWSSGARRRECRPGFWRSTPSAASPSPCRGRCAASIWRPPWGSFCTRRSAPRGCARGAADAIFSALCPPTWKSNQQATRPTEMLEKVAVVGAGNVGATAAQRLAEKSLARTVVMIDVVEGVPQGKGLDQYQSGPIEGFDTRIIGTQGYDEAAGADLFVVTAGIARKPGMSRDDLVKTNAGIVRSVAKEIARVAPKSIIVVVSNPLDVMCYVAMRASGFPRERVIGMAGVLDTARYRMFLAEAMHVSVEDIQA